MSSEAFKKADEAVRIGDSISDAQLDMLVRGYEAAETALGNIWHPTYTLTLNDIRSRLDSLRGFQRARAESRREAWALQR